MRFMVMVKATADSEAGVMPSEELLAAMGRYNEELAQAGVMLAGEHHPGLRQFLVVAAHGRQQLLAGHHTGFGICSRLDHHHETHRLSPCSSRNSAGVSLRLTLNPWLGF